MASLAATSTSNAATPRHQMPAATPIANATKATITRGSAKAATRSFKGDADPLPADVLLRASAFPSASRAKACLSARAPASDSVRAPGMSRSVSTYTQAIEHPVGSKQNRSPWMPSVPTLASKLSSCPSEMPMVKTSKPVQTVCASSRARLNLLGTINRPRRTPMPMATKISKPAHLPIHKHQVGSHE